MFTRLQPVLYVRDLAAEVAFYQQLGFTVAHETRDFAGIVYGEAILFGLQARDVIDPGQIIWQIGVASVDNLAGHCQEAGIVPVEPPLLQPWGEWTMTVQSPNGYQVIFEGPA